jgi:hypothetical protein
MGGKNNGAAERDKGRSLSLISLVPFASVVKSGARCFSLLSYSDYYYYFSTFPIVVFLPWAHKWWTFRGSDDGFYRYYFSTLNRKSSV